VTEAWVRLDARQRQLAGQIARKLHVQPMTVVFMILAGGIALEEGRLDAEGEELLRQLLASMDVEVTPEQQQAPSGPAFTPALVNQAMNEWRARRGLPAEDDDVDRSMDFVERYGPDES